MATRNRNSSLDEKLARAAKAEAARTKARGGGTLGGPPDRISIRDKKFSLGDTLLDKETKGRRFSGVILGFNYANTYYEGAFNANAPKPPVCWALSEDGKEMRPHKNSADRQSKFCVDCPQNEPGSGKSGNKNSRACKQGMRIAIVHVDDVEDKESAKEAKIGWIDLPVMSVRPLLDYAKEIREKLGRPLFSVITEFSFDDEQTYPAVNYSMVKKISNESLFDVLEERSTEALEKIMTPYNKINDDDEAEDDEDEDEDDEDEDEKPARKRRVVDEDDEKPTRRKKKKVVDEDEDEDEDEDDSAPFDEDEDEDEEDKKPTRKVKKKKRVVKDEDDDDEEDDDADDADEEDEEEEKPRRSRKSRFG